MTKDEPPIAVDAVTGEEIARLEIASSFWARFRGLMLRSALKPGSGLLIRPCGSIHMMFMRFPIDAVFLDAQGRVTNVSRNVRPWIGMARGGRHTKAVIELPAGAAGRIGPGQQITW